MSKKNSRLERVHPVLARVWVAVVVGIFAAFAWFATHAPLETNVMKLLPASADTAGPPPAVVDAAMKRLDQQLIWLVADEPPATPRTTPTAAPAVPPAASTAPAAPALWWQQQLEALPDLKNVAGVVTEKQQAEWFEFNFRYRALRLDAATAGRLRTAPAAWAQWVLAQVYSPFAGVGADELQRDPLLLMRSQQAAQEAGRGTSAFALDHGWPTVRERNADAAAVSPEKTWRLVRAELRGAAFDMASSQRLIAQLDALNVAFAKRFPSAEILRRGTLFYSDFAAGQARHDMSTIGVASLLGIVFVILLFFRSPHPLWMVLLSTGVGMAAGFAGMFLVFGQVHVISLVLSTSVVGISVDYALHFLTARMLHSAAETPLQTLAKLLPVLGMAALTSALAYAVLLVAPFPGLRQLAVCAGFGLSAAFATVVCWFPFLSRKMKPRQPAGIWVAALWLRQWRRNRALRIGLPLAFALAGAAGLLRSTVNDDVGMLQGLPDVLVKQERRIAALMGQDGGQSWLVVHGATGEAVLQTMEKLEPKLVRMQTDGGLKSLQLLSRQLPSALRQRENAALVAAAAPVVRAKLQETDVVGAETAPPQTETLALLTPALWRKNFASEGWRHLWFEGDGHAAAFVPVTGADNARMTALAHDAAGVHWLNRRAELSELLAVHRQGLGTLLLGSVLLVGAFFMVRFGVVAGVRCSLPIIIAMLFGLSLPALLGLPLNLFSILALVLVLGIGIDYTLFFANRDSTAITAMLSVGVAAVTTQLTFGMLILSSTPAIRGFGAVLAGGIFVAFALAPLAAPTAKRKRNGASSTPVSTPTPAPAPTPTPTPTQ
jgi:predicted exporter